MTGRRGRRLRQIPIDVKEPRGCGKLEEETQYRTVWELVLQEAMDPSQGRLGSE